MEKNMEYNQTTTNSPLYTTRTTTSNDKKSFTKRKGTADVGKDYENYFMANLVLNLTSNNSIQDFYVWSNDEKFGAFDDIIIETQSNDSVKCAVQLKHVMKAEKQLSSESLMGDKGNFSIKKYFQSFQKYKSSLSDYELILFTNLKFNPDENMELQLSDKENFTVRIMEVEGISWFNTCRENNKCYRFEIIQKDGEQLSTTLKNYKEFFDQFFVYANQIGVDGLKNQIYKQMESSYSCKEDISFTFLKFFGKWNLQEGIKEKLHKSMAKRLIALQLVSSRIRPISFGAVNNHRQILQNAMLNFDVTVFDKKFAVDLEKIWIEDRGNIDVKEIAIVNKNYQITVDRFDKVETLSDIECTKLLWLMGKCPLILNENPSVYEVLRLGIDRRFILVRENGTNDDLDKYSVFHKLNDLRSHGQIHAEILSNFKCLVSGKKISLRQLVESNEMQTILTANDLLLMVDGAYEIKQEFEDLPFPYIPRQLTRNIIDYKFLDNLKKEALVLITNIETTTKTLLRKYNFLDVQEYLVMNQEDITINFTQEPIVLTSQYGITADTFRTICQKAEKKSYHHLKIFNGTLEWINTVGDTLGLLRYRTENYSIEEKELSQIHSENNIHIVTGDPGLGKTWLLQSLKNSFSSQTIAIIFTPKDMKKICSLLENDSKNIEKLEDYICEIKHSNLNNLGKLCVRSFLRKNKAIFLWDALDEVVPNSYLNTILEIIQMFSEKGTVQWLTCRRHMKKILESEFKVLSKTLLEFSEPQQTEYIKKRLTSVCSPQDINEIAQRILENVTNFKTRDILSIPLQIFMLTEICRKDINRFEKLLRDIFSLADIYEKFIEDKFIFRYKKHINSADFDIEDVEEETNALIQIYEQAALKAVLQDDILEELNINIDETLEEIQHVPDRFGFVTEVTNNNSNINITFVHISYAEYFVGAYFARRKISKIKNFIFEERYTNVRYFMDLILARNCPAHIAVLCNNLTELKKHENEIKINDGAGRNALQLASSWGERCKLLDCTTVDEITHINNFDYDYTQLPQRPQEYLELVEMLCRKCDFNEVDELFELNAIQYAEKCEGIFALAVLETEHQINYFQTKSEDFKCSSLYHFVTRGLGKFIVLLQSYVNRITVGLDKDTLLLLAIERGNEEVFENLINAGASVNASNGRFDTPLVNACEANNEKFVDLLITKGSNVNKSNGSGVLPLHRACENTNEKIIQSLVGAGADVNGRDIYGNTIFQRACSSFDASILRFLMNAGTDINATNINNDTVLQNACRTNKIKVVQLHIDIGVDINTTNQRKETLLLIACRHNHTDLAHLLILNKADVNKPDARGDTPLKLACRRGNEALVKMLLDAGADTNASNKNGDTPFRSACEYGHEKIAEMLMRSGADTTSPNKTGDTPLHIACSQGIANIVKLLVTEVDVNVFNENGETPLKFACENNHENIVEMLIKSGADVNDSNRLGDTPLHFACSKGNTKIVSLLIDAKAKINASNQNGQTSLHLACQNGNDEVVTILITNGAKVNATNRNGDCPLGFASSNGNDRVVVSLMNAGAEPNWSNKHGITPLIIACAKNNNQVAQLLISAGAKVNLSNALGRTALMVAASNNNEELVQLLIDVGADVNFLTNNRSSALTFAAISGHANIAQILLTCGAEVNLRDADGTTPLIEASAWGHYEVVELLLTFGAEVNVVDKDGSTALGSAVHNNHERIVDLLIENGADLYFLENISSTPLYCYCEGGNFESVCSLIKMGVNLETVVYNGWRAIHIACFQGHTKIVERLIYSGANVEALTSSGDSPIELARENGHMSIVELIERYIRNSLPIL